MTLPSPSCDVVIVGAGIIGLATALEFTARHPDQRLVVLEKEDRVAAHQTGHNSGVIHMGMYYKPGSSKASLCVSGATSLKDFCDQQGVPYQLVGKVIVATDARESAALDVLAERGRANGVPGLELVGPERLAELEPHATGLKALHSPHTGIIDYKQVAQAYKRCITERGGHVVTGAGVSAITRRRDGLTLTTARGELLATHLINCAGLYSDRIARLMGHDPGLRIIPFRGEYHTLAAHREHLVKGLIYPVPDARFPFLGVHFTRMIGGGVEAGPNAVLAFAREGYTKGTIRPRELLGTLAWPGFWRLAGRYWRTGSAEFLRSFSRGAFTRALQRLVPEVQRQDLQPGGAGVRAQAVDAHGGLVDDFRIVEADGAFHVLNAPSPGATSSLAIARHIVQRAAATFGLPVHETAPSSG